MTRGDIDRLQINLPPRHAKTETVTARYPAYRLIREPRLRILITGYNERFARRLSRRARNIALEVGIHLAPDKSASDEWETLAGGLVMARGVGSPPTGVGFDLVLIDDPIRRREDADSETFREKLTDWYADDLYTRLEPGGTIVLTMTRWHEEDLGAFAPGQEPGRWEHLILPALAEADDPLGRAEGEALWPARFDAAALARIRGVLDPRSWLALYQQRPTPLEGAFFKPAQVLSGPVPAPGRFASLCRAWDKAASISGDFTAGVLVGLAEDGLYWILDVVRARTSPDEADKLIRSTAEFDAARFGAGRVLQRGPQDPGQAGVRDALAFTRLLAGHYIKTAPVSGSKEVRASPVASQVNAGNFRRPVGEGGQPPAWWKDFVQELLLFPRGANDDQVDALADAFAEVALMLRVLTEDDV